MFEITIYKMTGKKKIQFTNKKECFEYARKLDGEYAEIKENGRIIAEKESHRKNLTML